MNPYLQTLIGRSIYHSDAIEIRQNLCYRWLSFQDRTCIQTIIHRHWPHKAAMSYLAPFTLALRAQPGPTCLLGLGGGAVVHFATPYLKSHPVLAIEADDEVIRLASQYFMLDTIPTLTILHQQAQTFIAQANTSYQHILIDIYTATGFPKSCAQQDFFAQCKQQLTADGFLALNLVNFQREFFILTHLRAVFNQVTLCIPTPSSANMIVLAAHSSEALLALVNTNTKLKTLVWDSVFGYMARISAI